MLWLRFTSTPDNAKFAAIADATNSGGALSCINIAWFQDHIGDGKGNVYLIRQVFWRPTGRLCLLEHSFDPPAQLWFQLHDLMQA